MRTITATMRGGKYDTSVINKILKNGVAKPEQVVFYFAATNEKNPKIVCAYLDADNKGRVVSGSPITDNDVKSHAMVVVPANNQKELEPNPKYHEKHSVGDRVTIGGRKFTAVGLRSDGDYDEVPYTTAFSDFRLTGFDFLAPQGLTDTEKKQIGDYFSLSLDTADVKLPKPMAQKLLTNLFFPLVASVFTGIIAILNFIFLYRYMIERCRKDYTIIRICGCSRAKSLLIMFSQFLLLFAASYILSVFGIAVLKLCGVPAFKPVTLSAFGCIAVFITFVVIILPLMLPVGIKFFRESIAGEVMRLS